MMTWSLFLVVVVGVGQGSEGSRGVPTQGSAGSDAQCRSVLSAGWRVCVSQQDQPCSSSWPSPELPTTALAARLASPAASEVFKAPGPRLRPGETVVDPFYSRNLELIRDVNETGRDFYTLRWERALEEAGGCGSFRTLELPGVNYRVRAFVNDDEPLEARTAFGGAFARVSFDLPAGARRVALVIEPPDHCGSPNCTTEPYGQGGDHSLAQDVTPQYFLGWDWMAAIPDRSTGFLGGAPVLREHDGATIADLAVQTVSVNERRGARGDVTLALVFTLSGGPGTWRCDFLGQTLSGEAQGEVRREVNVSDVELWWPHGLITGSRAKLHVANFSLGSMSAGSAGDQAQAARRSEVTGPRRQFIKFGVRSCSFNGSYLSVNGVAVLVKGGNWVGTSAIASAEHSSRERYAQEIALHVRAGLNLIRVWGGGVSETDAFYEATDYMGVMVYQEFWMTGDNNGRWAGSYDWPVDKAAYAAAVADVVRRQRRFASLVLYGGGNELDPKSKSPPPDCWAALLQNIEIPLIASSMDGGVLGGDPEKHDSAYAVAVKDGPYTMLLPTQWSELNPGLSGVEELIAFQPEIGSASVPASREALLRFLTLEEAGDWPRGGREVNAAWRLHRYESFASADYDHVASYGDAESLDEWLAFAGLAQYQQYQYLFESFLSRMASVIMWKTQSPWPSLRGFLYDWYLLEPTGGLFGAAAANKERSLVLDQRSRAFYLANAMVEPWLLPRSMSYDWFDSSGEWLKGDQRNLSLTIIPPTSAQRISDFDASDFPELFVNTVAWLRLSLGKHRRKWYWLTANASRPDHSQVGEMHRAQRGRLEIRALTCGAGVVHLTIAASADSPELVFYPRASLSQQQSLMLPLEPEDDGLPLVLLPGEAATVDLRLDSSQGEAMLDIRSLNAPTLRRTISCSAPSS